MENDDNVNKLLEAEQQKVSVKNTYEQQLFQRYLNYFPIEEQDDAAKDFCNQMVDYMWSEPTNFYNKLWDTLYNDIPEKSTHLAWDMPIWNHCIVYNNHFVPPLKDKDGFTVHTNFRILNSKKELQEFIKQKYPIHRITKQSGVIYERKPKSFSLYKKSFEQNDIVPQKNVVRYVVQYYKDAKLSWLENKLQFVISKFRTLPDFVEKYIRQRVHA